MVKNKSFIMSILFYAFGGLLVLAGILTAVLFFKETQGLGLVFLIGFDVCIFAVGILMIYLPVTFPTTLPNFFLYNRKTQENISSDDLSFNGINSRMTLFMSRVSSSQSDAWTSDLMSKGPEVFGEGNIFKPLVAYKMLFDLAAQDNGGVWEFFTNAREDVINSLTESLAMNGDGEMGKMLSALYSAKDEGTKRLRDFLLGNQKYLQNRMMNYCIANIQAFSSKDGMGIITENN